jgi:hypothetical protein
MTQDVNCDKFHCSLMQQYHTVFVQTEMAECRVMYYTVFQIHHVYMNVYSSTFEWMGASEPLM